MLGRLICLEGLDQGIDDGTRRLVDDQRVARPGCLGHEPVRDLALQQLVALELELGGDVRTELARAGVVEIEERREYRHALAVAAGHGLVHLLHPMSSRWRQCAAVDQVGADLVAEHPLHLDRRQVDDPRIVAVVEEAERVDVRVERQADRALARIGRFDPGAPRWRVGFVGVALVEQEALVVEAVVGHHSVFLAFDEGFLAVETLQRDDVAARRRCGARVVRHLVDTVDGRLAEVGVRTPACRQYERDDEKGRECPKALHDLPLDHRSSSRALRCEGRTSVGDGDGLDLDEPLGTRQRADADQRRGARTSCSRFGRKSIAWRSWRLTK